MDLEQEVDFTNNAQAAPWALVIANPGTTDTTVTIEQNDAAPRAPAQIKVVLRMPVM